MIEGGPALSRLVCMFRSQIWIFSLFSLAICSFTLEHHSDFKQRRFIFFCRNATLSIRVVGSDDTVWCDIRAEFSRFASHFQCQIHRFKCEINPTGRGAQPSWYTGIAFRRGRDSAFSCRHMFTLSLLGGVWRRGWVLASSLKKSFSARIFTS